MKIFVLKSWWVACAIFCILSLQMLFEERHEVAILAVNRNETDPIIYLVCKELSRFQLKETEILLEDLRDQLVNHFRRVGNSFTKELVLNLLKTGQYLIFSGLLCFPLNEKDKHYTSEILSPPVYLAFTNSTLDFAQIASLRESFDQMIVQKKGPPYSSCSESNERFRSLNECFRNFRLSRYLYQGNETGLNIQLKPVINQTIEENERRCFEENQRENCKIVQLSPIPIYKKPEITTLEAQPKLSEFDYWVQFIGLVCSFANISFNQLTSLVITFAISKVKRRRVRIGLFCLKWAILFLSLACCGYLYTKKFLDHLAEEKNPPRKEITRNHIKQKTVRLAICVDIKDYLKRYSYSLDINRLNKTMSEIEKATDKALNDRLESIHLNYQGRKFVVNYKPEPNVFFKRFISQRGIHTNIFSRCFVLQILPDYKLLPSNPKLTIKFRGVIHDFKFYLLTENENLNEETFEYKTKTFMKRVVKRLEGRGCVNYRERYGSCTSRSHCVERCINRKALNKFKKIPIDKAVVDKDQFSPEEWNTNYSMTISSSNDRTTYKNLSEECEKKFPVENHCVEVKFIETVQIFQPDQTKEIDLFINFKLLIEEFSWFKLLLDILNIQSIFFGMTVLRLLGMLYNFFKPKLRMKMRNDKIAHFLIYLLCSFGFTYHTYRILDLTINEKLTYNPDYEIANRVRMPVLVFCLPIDEKLIDKNHQLTGNYLEQVTSHMKAKSVFIGIRYLNESNEWIPFNLSLVEQFFFLHLKCFRVTIHREYDRRQLHFTTFSQTLEVLKVDFTYKFWNEVRNKIFFMTKTNETEFSNIVGLLYEDLNDGSEDDEDYSDTLTRRYSAEQNQFTLNYEDNLSFIKRVFSSSYEDDFSDFDGQLPEMKSNELSFRTLKVPVEKEDFDFELRGDLLDQLSTQINSRISRDNFDYFTQKFVFNQLKDVTSGPDFTFSLSLIKKSLSIKNDDIAKLVLNLLNLLFLWFDLGILDLHPIFILTHDYLLVYLYLHLPVYLLVKITQFVIFSHRWLKKFEAPLYERLEHLTQNSLQTIQV